MISVNPHALEEARKDDELRAEGDTAPLLGIPIAAKDIYDTTEMPTTGGSLVFENYVPEKNSFIVQQLIDAGAIIIGKANLSEFANSGFYSASAYGQVWNAFDPVEGLDRIEWRLRRRGGDQHGRRRPRHPDR